MKHTNIEKLEKIKSSIFDPNSYCYRQLNEIIKSEKEFNKKVLDLCKDISFTTDTIEEVKKELQPEEKKELFTEEQREAIKTALNDLILKLNER